MLPRPLIGRQHELALARRWIVAEGARLVTLTGPPGVGKTSLALTLAGELLDRFPGGVSFVELAAVVEADQVATTVAEAVGARVSGGRRPRERLVDHLRGRDLLLVLDNFEQVLSAAPLVGELLARCPALCVVVTSRAPLRLRWEQELLVPPLALPDLSKPTTPSDLVQTPAVMLFADRARAVRHDFALGSGNARAVAELCVRLDGLPLAIELAAARTRMLTPAAILSQLTETSGGRAGSLRVLTDGPRDLPARQQTLRDAITGSYEPLDDEERRLFRRLAIFAGGCTYEAAEAVCDATWETVGSLIEKSLVRQDPQPDGTPRLRMLETIREFAHELLLTSAEAPEIAARHAAYFLELAEQAEPELTGPDQVTWLDRLTREQDNLQAATSWAVEHDDPETVLRLGAALWRFWWSRGDGAETRERVAGILALAGVATPTRARAKALHGAGVLARLLGDYPAAQTMFEESRDVAAAIGDRHSLATALYDLGRLAYFRGDHSTSRCLLEEALATLQALDPNPVFSSTLASLGYLAYLEGEYGKTRSWAEEGLRVARLIDDHRAIADAIHLVGLSFHAEWAIDAARAQYDQCLEMFQALGDRHTVSMTLSDLGSLAAMEGNIAEARARYRAGLGLAREAGNQRRVAMTLAALAALAAVVGDAERAIRFDGAATRELDMLGVTLAPGMRAIYDRQLEPARQAFGDLGVAADDADSQPPTLDQVVEEALAWLTDGENDSDLAASADQMNDCAAEARRSGATDRPPTKAPTVPRSRTPLTDQLPRRELAVARLVAQGMTNRQIATELVITEGTASNYVRRIMTRLDFRSRAQIAAWIVERGLQDFQDSDVTH